MSRDSLIPLEPARARNDRLWDTGRVDPPITPVGAVRNAATLDDAKRLAGMNPHLSHREDTRAAMVAGREQREAPARAQETTMPVPTAETLRTYLLRHGPTDREDLRQKLGYVAHYATEAVARTMLNKHLREIGAVNNGARKGPMWIPAADGTPKRVLAGEDVAKFLDKVTADTPAPALAAGPLRPSLADDAIRYVREGAEGPGVELPAEYCRALLGRLS